VTGKGLFKLPRRFSQPIGVPTWIRKNPAQKLGRKASKSARKTGDGFPMDRPVNPRREETAGEGSEPHSKTPVTGTRGNQDN